MYRIILLLLITLGFSLHSFAQQSSLEGIWVIKSIKRTLNNGIVIIDYDHTSENNLMDVSNIEMNHQSNGVLTGKTIYGTDLVEGTWSYNGTHILYNNKSLIAEITNANEFATVKPYNMTDAFGEAINSTLRTTYIRQSAFPIELSSFNLERNDQNNRLSWSSGAEVNFSHFDVEKSINGRSFSSISRVQARGSNSDYTYNDVDAFIESRTVYYRLKIIDQDEIFKYSMTKSASIEEDRVEVFPNPTSDVIRYELNDSEATSYRITNMTGEVVLSGLIANDTTVDLGNLPEGVYIIAFLKEETPISQNKVVRL